MVGALLCSFAEGLEWKFLLPELAVSQTKASSIAYSISVTLLIFSFYYRSHITNRGFFSWIGSTSYFIYLFHLIPIAVATKLASSLHISSVSFEKVVFVACVAIVLSIGAAAAARFALPEKAQKWILG